MQSPHLGWSARWSPERKMSPLILQEWWRVHSIPRSSSDDCHKDKGLSFWSYCTFLSGSSHFWAVPQFLQMDTALFSPSPKSSVLASQKACAFGLFSGHGNFIVILFLEKLIPSSSPIICLEHKSMERTQWQIALLASKLRGWKMADSYPQSNHLFFTVKRSIAIIIVIINTAFFYWYCYYDCLNALQ